MDKSKKLDFTYKIPTSIAFLKIIELKNVATTLK